MPRFSLHHRLPGFVAAVILLLQAGNVAAFEAPAAQTPLRADQILRGNFSQVSQFKQTNAVGETSGHFQVMPGREMDWYIEKPFPTFVTITPNGAVQNLGGVTIKLPVKNLEHIYTMVSQAIAGNWNGLEADFDLNLVTNAEHWQIFLTPHHDGRPTVPYTSIAVSGGHFVENIVMLKADGSFDTISFTDMKL